jgi:hypothetical protein
MAIKHHPDKGGDPDKVKKNFHLILFISYNSADFKYLYI